LLADAQRHPLLDEYGEHAEGHSKVAEILAAALAILPVPAGA
jgi:hypothetical protein